MSFKVHVGPPQIAIHQGQTVLVSEPDGQINWPSDKGLYFLDTRIVSSWSIYANGEPWELLNGGPVTYYAARIFLTNKSILTEDGTILPRTMGLTISRSISGGLHEDLDITNNSMRPVRFQLEIAFRCDFADVFEVKSGHIVRRGQITTEWSERRQRRSHRVFEPGFSPCSDNLGVARTGQGGFRQWAAQLRGRPSAERGLARLLALHARGWRATLPGAARLRWQESQVPPFRDDGGMVEDSGQDRDKQRRILSSLSPGVGGHGCAAFADQGHRPHGLPACCRTAVVRRSVRPRQPHRFAAEYPDLSGIRPRRIGDPRLAASQGGRSLPRCGARQDSPRTALRRARAFQADPAYALLRNRGCDAALSDNPALPLGARPATKGCWNSICRPRKAASPGSTNTATATATDFRSIRRARRLATRTWPGRIPAMLSCIRMDRW